MSLREGTGTSRSAAQQWHAARGMQNLAKQPKDDHATSLGQNRSAPCIRGRQCAPRRSGAAIRQHRGGIPLGSRSKCGVRPRAASAMVPRGGHRLNEPVVGEVGGRGGGGPDPLHPETPPFSKRVFGWVRVNLFSPAFGHASLRPCSASALQRPLISSYPAPRWQGFAPANDTWQYETELLTQHGGRVAVGHYRARRQDVEAMPSYKLRTRNGRNAPLPTLRAATAKRVADSLRSYDVALQQNS